MTRVGLSIKLGTLGGIIWGLFFIAYYSMLPNFEFAWRSATVFFIVIVVIILGLPSLIRSFKKAHEEGKKKMAEKYGKEKNE